MATIKSYTDLQQSKKLAEILPHESADMLYWAGEYITHPYTEGQHKDEQIPIWSLAALLDILPILDNRSPVMSKTFDGKYRVTYHSTAYEMAILTSDYDNSVDACVAMIEKLNELNLL